MAVQLRHYFPIERKGDTSVPRFSNWSKSISERSMDRIYRVSKSSEIQDIVRQVISEEPKKRIRCVGFGHSWTDFYPDENQILIQMVSETKNERKDDDDLQAITLVSPTRVRVGAAVTNTQFRNFANQHGICIPYNVIISENTFGGTNGGLCHGGGIKTGILSDLVSEIGMIDTQGKLRVFKEKDEGPEVMNAVTASMGILGIVTYLVLKVEVMRFVELAPVKVRREVGVPPPHVSSGGVFEAFRKRIMSDYNEFFWFMYEPEVYVNCWNVLPAKRNPKETVPYPKDGDLEEWEEYATQVITDSRIAQLVPDIWQADLFGKATMNFVSTERATATIMDAIHFRRGIHNFRLLDAELQVPLPESKRHPGEPDLLYIQSLWWKAIEIIEDWKAKKQEAPIKLVLEMRVYGGSPCYLAPCSGNRWTLAIEVESFNTSMPVFLQAVQTIYDAWAKLLPIDLTPTQPRPHLAKIWQGLSWRGQPMETYIKEKGYLMTVSGKQVVNKIEEFSNIRQRLQLHEKNKNLFTNCLLQGLFD